MSRFFIFRPVFAGVIAIRKGLAKPIGSLTQMGTIRLGKRTDNRNPLIKDFVPLASLEDIVFGAWDPFPDDAYIAATRAGVLESGKHIEAVADALREVRPMPAAFDREYVKRIDADNTLHTIDKRSMLNAIREDINRFREEKQVDRVVMLWAASTEIFIEEGPAHQSIEAFNAAIDANDPTIAPSMLYAYAAILEGVPFANGAPNLTVDIPVLRELAIQHKVPISGKDFKTGQTLIKTVLGPMLKARMLGLNGWYSTNILGNRDGEVLDDPESFKTKEVSKLGVLEHILDPETFPDLYGDVYHKVRINYYPPRGDNKEGWDNIDLFGWLGYPMQLKVDFLCRDSILAAPLALDLVLLGVLPVVALAMPIHPAAFGLVMLWQILFNVAGHTGYEFHPKWLMNTPLRLFLNTPTNHVMHHEKLRGNYGLYFNVWDRLMGTNHKDYEKRFEEVVTRVPPTHSPP